MNHDEPITPHALRGLRKNLRDSAVAYAEARRSVLRLAGDKRSVIAREHRIGEALEARFWYHRDLRVLREAEQRPCIKGSAVSPKAKARAIASGRWKADE